jgi:hypothetical protein
MGRRIAVFAIAITGFNLFLAGDWQFIVSTAVASADEARQSQEPVPVASGGVGSPRKYTPVERMAPARLKAIYIR